MRQERIPPFRCLMCIWTWEVWQSLPKAWASISVRYLSIFSSFIYSLMDAQGQPEMLSEGRALLFNVKQIRRWKFKLKCSNRGSQISTLLISSLHKIFGKIPELTRISGLCKVSPRWWCTGSRKRIPKLRFRKSFCFSRILLFVESLSVLCSDMCRIFRNY